MFTKIGMVVTKNVKILTNIWIFKINVVYLYFNFICRFRYNTFEELQKNLKFAGITGNVIGITPKLKYVDDSYSVPRGCEIKAWMERNKGILGVKMTEVKYAILDDDTDMLYWQRNSFFCTKGRSGLTKAIANKVIKHLI